MSVTRIFVWFTHQSAHSHSPLIFINKTKLFVREKNHHEERFSLWAPALSLTEQERHQEGGGKEDRECSTFKAHGCNSEDQYCCSSCSRQTKKKDKVTGVIFVTVSRTRLLCSRIHQQYILQHVSVRADGRLQGCPRNDQHGTGSRDRCGQKF